jgi:hypothetical protein
MQTTSDSPRPKRAASKPRAAGGPTVTVKKSRKPKSPPAEAAPTVSAVEPEKIAPAMVSTDLADQVAVAAYFLAEERGFAPGHELDDWLEAERRIRGADPRAGLS